jgi:glycosyltransferase involved in cell wall biosynthesis
MSGPVDGAQVVDAYLNNKSLAYFGTSYLKEFCGVIESMDATGVVLTYSANDDSMDRIGRFSVFNLKRIGRSGLGYHIESARRIVRSLAILRKERVGTLVLTEGADYWFLMVMARAWGVRIVPALHCRLWSPFEPQKPAHAVLRWLNRHLFFRWQKDPVLIASDDIGRQARAQCGSGPEIMVFLPTYRREDFAMIEDASERRNETFVILSAGRIEENKGVFDMIEAARILIDRRLSFQLHFCGEGTALEALRKRVKEDGLEDHVFVHGFCGRERLIAMFNKSHAVVVPTRTSFEEGFAMICAEAILAGRPLVTSRVCPAIEYVRPATVEVEPNDVEGYAAAFIRLIEDPDFYARKQHATKALQDQFYDPGKGYGAALAKALRYVGVNA